MRKYTLLSLLFIFLVSISHANVIESYLEIVEQQFDTTTKEAERFDIVAKPINITYLKQLKHISDLDEQELTKGVGPKIFEATVTTKPTDYNHDPKVKTKQVVNYNRTNALAVAIAMGDVFLVQKFLTSVHDINDPRLISWGYRQPFSVAHQVIDPQVYFYKNVPHEHKLAIIDLVAAKGADFNLKYNHPYPGIYNNPPLTAGDLRGGCYEHHHEMRALGLLYGGEHILKGSSHRGEDLLRDYYTHTDTQKALVDYYIIRKKAGIAMRPTDAVMKRLHELAAARNINLDAITEKDQEINFIDRLVLIGSYKNELPSLETEVKDISSKLEKNTTRIAEFKKYKTKRQKRYVRHLEDIQQELQREYAKMCKKLRKLKALLHQVEF